MDIPSLICFCENVQISSKWLIVNISEEVLKKIFAYFFKKGSSIFENSSGEVYYHGRAADGQTMQDVARRHANTVGDDGARFGDGDTLFVKTPPKTPRNTVRGIEQRGIEEKKY